MDRTTLRVLLVEDNPADARLIELLLQRTGTPAIHARAETIEQAEQLVRTGVEGRAPDVVLLDMGLPGIAPESTVSWMHALAPRVPIVVLSGESDEQVSVRAVRDGAQDYLVKGRIDAELLHRAIRYAIERKRAEVALKESEDRFARFMDKNPVIAFMKDSQGQYLYANRLFEHTLGLAAGQWRGKRDDQLLPSHAAEPLKASDAAVLIGGESIEIHEIVPGIDGNREWLTFKFPFTNAQGERHLAGMAVDITRRVRAEEALREAESARLEAVQLQSDTLNALPAHVVLIGAGGELVVGNEAWRHHAMTSGFNPDLLRPPCNYLELLRTTLAGSGTDPAWGVNGLSSVLDGEKAQFSYEYSVAGEGGSARWFLMVATGLTGPGRRGAVVMHTDVTDRRRSQELLTQSENRYRRVVDTAQEGIWVSDLQGKATLINQRMAAILGYSTSSLLGRAIREFAADSPRGDREFGEVVRSSKPSQYELQLRRGDGQWIWVSISACGMYDERGRFEGTLRMISDITERRAAEAALREAEEQLRQAQKMEAVGQLAGGIAHDFNNLLTAIRGYASLARASLSEGHAALESLDQVEEAARQATGVAAALQTFARKKRAEKQPVRFVSIIEESCRLFRRTLGPKITVHVDLRHAADVWVNGDETQLHQVVTNLALNAADAIEGKGEISIRLERLKVPPPALAIAAHARDDDLAGNADGWACLSVQDNGRGMSPDVRARIFEPFFSTKPRSSGTGLGLSVIHGIVQEHNGIIEVESQPEKGSTFLVFLPCIASPHGSRGEPAASGGQGGVVRPPGPVMLVQNNPMVRGVVASMLAKLDYEIIHAKDCSQAQAESASMRRPLGLLVADLTLPDGGCVELYSRLRVQWPELKCILIADIMSEELPEEPRLVHLRKPFRTSDLESCLSVLAGEGLMM
jgi:PAS domain S-box-containing protein